MNRGIYSKKIIGLTFLVLGVFFLTDNSVAEEEERTQIPVHLNFKESAKFSPETSGDPERMAMEEKYSSHEQNPGGGTPVDTRNKGDWTSMGEWQSDNVLFDVTLNNVIFNLWWVEDPDDTDYDAALDLRWTVFVEGVEIFQFTDEQGRACEETRDDPCEYSQSPTETFPSTTLTQGQFISLKVEMKSFQSIYIYYDNFSRDSGMKVDADVVIFGDTSISGQSLSFEFVEAWPTDCNEAMEGNFITLMLGSGIELDNNLQKSGYPKVEKGKKYTLNGTEYDSEKITWFIDDEYEKLEETMISFSYARKSSSTVEPIIINVADRLISSSGDEEEGALGGLPGFEFAAVISALFAASFVRRKV